jgi:hypothetical protein
MVFVPLLFYRSRLSFVLGANFTETLHNNTYLAINPSKPIRKSRSVFITGGSRGIGRATAISFAKVGAACIALGDITSFENLEAELHNAAKSAGHNVALEIVLLRLNFWIGAPYSTQQKRSRRVSTR